jgi:tripartite-type tricarboxylate transporter receptor subunit TctC
MTRIPGLALAATLLLALLAAGGADAQSKFFEGKTVRIVVGFSAGGGYDTYSRAIGRHLGRHIPGKPTVIVENMPGAGSLIAANHLYKIAKPDGLTLGNFAGGLVLAQVLGQPGIEFDARKFAWVGTPSREVSVCALTKASGITSIETWMAAKTPVKLGGTGPGATTDDVPRVLAGTLGLPIHVVRGYKGTAEIRLAAESGEIAGGCWQWESVKSTWRQGLDSGDVNVLLQVAAKPVADLPKVATALGLARTDEARQLITAGIIIPTEIGRIYALPPGTPADRVQAIRAAFNDTMRDAEFLADAKRSKLETDSMNGDDVTRVVNELFKLDPAIAAKLKGLFK